MQRSSLVLVVIALVAGFAAAWPPLHLVLVNANLSSYYQENIGYRFFWVLRLVEGWGSDFVHPGQGVLLPLIQAIYYLIGKWAGLDLYGQIHLFALLTEAVPAVAMIALGCFIACDRQVGPSIRLALVVTPLVMAFGGPQMFSYDTYPDYTAYAKVAFLWFTWRWLHHRGWLGIESTRAAIELGILGGLMAALKLNYAIWPAGLLLGSLLVMLPAQWMQAFRGACLIGCSGTAALAGPFLLHYRGHIEQIEQFFRVVFAWSAALAGFSDFTIRLFPPKEPIFDVGGPPTGNAHANETTLGWLIVITTALLIFALIVELKKRRLYSVTHLVIAALLGVLAVCMAFLRGGGSSYFEAVIMLSLLPVLVVASIGSSAPRRVAAGGLALMLAVWPTLWIATNWRVYETVAVTGHESLLKLAEAGDWQRRLFNWNRSHDLPIYVLTPTNYYTQGSIEDMMMLGFTDWPNHTEDSNHNPTRQRLFPQYTFLFFSDVAPNPTYKMALPPQRVVFMKVVGNPVLDYPQLDPKVAERHQREIEQLVAGRHQEQCYTQTQIHTHMEIVSCVLSVPGG